MPWVEGLVWGGWLIWLTVLVLPWRPWSIAERLESAEDDARGDLRDVVVLVPARNEANVLAKTLSGLGGQGAGLKLVVVDDQSTDRTADVVRGCGVADLVLVPGRAIPEGWTGKLWALEQGKDWLDRPLTLLLDADVVLSPGLVVALRRQLQQQGGGLVSLMVKLPTGTFWQRLLLPPFVYFFKLLYPFRRVNSGASRVAAAAGGCMLLETHVLGKIGAFYAFRDALIDDCALARRAKRLGFPTWIGLTRSATSERPVGGLRPIWNMVVRTAFTQLQYSIGWLLVCTTLMTMAFVGPVLAMLSASPWLMGAAVMAFMAMAASYWPTLRFYALPPYLALLLPVVGVLYLAMTWHSAVRFWRGERSRWKGRVYLRTESL
ncbi:MAG: glycosyltransferase [Gammaproteobacteria bacterium]